MQRMQEYDARHIFRAANFLKALKYGKGGPFAAAEVLWDQKKILVKVWLDWDSCCFCRYCFFVCCLLFYLEVLVLCRL